MLKKSYDKCCVAVGESVSKKSGCRLGLRIKNLYESFSDVLRVFVEGTVEIIEAEVLDFSSRPLSTTVLLRKSVRFGVLQEVFKPLKARAVGWQLWLSMRGAEWIELFKEGPCRCLEVGVGVSPVKHSLGYFWDACLFWDVCLG